MSTIYSILLSCLYVESMSGRFRLDESCILYSFVKRSRFFFVKSSVGFFRTTKYLLSECLCQSTPFPIFCSCILRFTILSVYLCLSHGHSVICQFKPFHSASRCDPGCHIRSLTLTAPKLTSIHEGFYYTIYAFYSAFKKKRECVALIFKVRILCYLNINSAIDGFGMVSKIIF